MASAVDPLSDARVELLRAFSDGPLPANEAAKRVGKQTPAIYSLLKRMYEDELVAAEPDPPTRGSVYNLTDVGRRALASALAVRKQPGSLHAGQQLLLIDQPARLADALSVFAREAVSGAVDWAAEVGGGWLLALSPELDDSFALMQLRRALEQERISCRQLTLDRLLSGADLRLRAASLSGSADTHT